MLASTNVDVIFVLSITIFFLFLVIVGRSGEKGIKLLRNIQILRFYMEKDKNLRSPYLPYKEDKQLHFLKYTQANTHRTKG